MKDLREVKKILQMEISRHRSTCNLWLSQENYILKMLERFNMTEVRSVSTSLAGHFRLSSSQCPNSQEEENEMSQVPFASAVRSLMYVIVCTRLDLPYTVGLVSQFMLNLGKQCWEAVKLVLRYLRGIVGLGLVFQRLKTENFKVLQVYVDADYGGDLDQ